MLLDEALMGAGRVERALPLADLLAVGLGQIFEPERRLDGAGDVIGPLHRACEPEEIVGGAREHRRQADPSGSSMIQMSFVPPPSLEFTTSDPSFTATPVRTP